MLLNGKKPGSIQQVTIKYVMANRKWSAAGLDMVELLLNPGSSDGDEGSSPEHSPDDADSPPDRCSSRLKRKDQGRSGRGHDGGTHRMKRNRLAKWNVGDEVWGLYQAQPEFAGWYPATVEEVEEVSTATVPPEGESYVSYRLRYFDGDEEDNVSEDRISREKPAQESAEEEVPVQESAVQESAVRYKRKDRVVYMGEHTGKVDFVYAPAPTKGRPDETYRIEYEHEG